MTGREPKAKVVKMSLTGAAITKADSQSTVIEQVTAPDLPPAVGITTDQLASSYDAILMANAIFYPVAYKFEQELGRGRQGRVFLAARQGARGCITYHAIKVFDPRLYRSSQEYWTDMGRIAFQMSRLHGLQSPNLVARHSYEESYGIGYVQMEAIDGMDLRRMLTRGHMEHAKQNCTPEEWARFTETVFRMEGDRVCLQPGVVVYILRRMLRGLERLHEANFLHCDVKPGNVMIDRLGSVKLVDFGRAVFVGERLSFLLGSPMYMAPETHRREPGGLQSDFFAVGLVGLEMLRGEPLVDASVVDEDRLLELKMDLANRLPELLPEHVRKKRSLTKIMRRLLEPEPKNRFVTAKEADVGDDGLVVVDKQLTKAGTDADYRRELSEYLSKLVDSRTGRIETNVDDPDNDNSSEVLLQR